MNERLSRYWERMNQYWKQFSNKQKIMVAATVVLLILSIVLVSYNMSKTEYSVVYRDLDPTDAAAIKAYLEGEGIPYKFSQDGSVIAVPTTMGTDVKIAAESQNLVRGGSLGFGKFTDNMNSFTMTDQEFDVVKVDLLAGEIEQLMNAMNGVNRAKAIVSLPEESAFIRPEGEEMASVSVLVTFQPGFRPEQAQIDTMYKLVSKAAPNLPVDNITISDQNNELLFSNTLNGGLETASTVADQQFKIKKQYEIDVQKNIMQYLGTLYGRDKVVVSVFSTLNFDKKTSSQNLVTPVNEEDGTGIVISEELNSSSTTGTSSEGGVAGTGGEEIPNYPGNAGGGSSSSESSNSKTNYEINRIQNEIISSPYVVTDLVINVGVEADKADSISQEDKDTIRSMLKQMVNTALANSGQKLASEELDGKVTVFTRTFTGKTVVEPSSSMSNTLLYGIGGAALALIAAGAMFAMRSRKKKAEIMMDDLQVTPKVELPTIDLETVSNDSQMRKQLESLAKKKPEEFVNLLRTWLVEE